MHRILNPWNLNPRMFIPGMQNPRKTIPRTIVQRIVNPRTISPRIISPRIINPRTISPKIISNPRILKCRICSPVIINYLDIQLINYLRNTGHVILVYWDYICNSWKKSPSIISHSRCFDIFLVHFLFFLVSLMEGAYMHKKMHQIEWCYEYQVQSVWLHFRMQVISEDTFENAQQRKTN